MLEVDRTKDTSLIGGIKGRLSRNSDVKSKELSNAEIDSAIKKMVHVINNRYSYAKCIEIVKNPRKIPEPMRELFKGSGINGLSVSNLNHKYNFEYKRGKCDKYEFLLDVKKLYDDLADGFAELVNEYYFGGIKTKKDNLSKEEMLEAIHKMFHAINENYSCNMNDVPDELYKFYKGSGVKGISVSNMEQKYIECRTGKYDLYEFMCDIEELFDALIDVYIELEDYFSYGGVERKEVNGYERA